jgi:putative mRNA 3-end processing factor
MLQLSSQGLYCPAGDFYIDPKGRVERAVVTHAHSDHARRGAKRYFTAASGVNLLRARLGPKIQVQGHAYGASFYLGPVKLSFHPAGHILGSAQVRLEYEGEVWVVSGDYKREPDPTCEPFEPIRCDVFVTEATFGTPGFRWPKEKNLGQEIFDWWEENRREGYNSVIFAYSLGKTQRVLGELFPYTDETIYCAPAATPHVQCYRDEGVKLAPTVCLGDLTPGTRLENGELILAPPSFLKSPLGAVVGERYRTAFASGWMAQGSHGYDHGFLMSDHADWDDLVRTVEETKARKVFVQHRGYGALVRHLRSLGLHAFPEEELARVSAEPAQLAFF